MFGLKFGFRNTPTTVLNEFVVVVVVEPLVSRSNVGEGWRATVVTVFVDESDRRFGSYNLVISKKLKIISLETWKSYGKGPEWSSKVGKGSEYF